MKLLPQKSSAERATIRSQAFLNKQRRALEILGDRYKHGGMPPF